MWTASFCPDHNHLTAPAPCQVCTDRTCVQSGLHLSSTASILDLLWDLVLLITSPISFSLRPPMRPSGRGCVSQFSMMIFWHTDSFPLIC